MPPGETTIVYDNNEYVNINLNNHGHICGIQEYFSERKRKIKINHAFIDPELQWTKAENSTLYSFYDKISDKTILQPQQFTSKRLCDIHNLRT